MDDTSPAFRNTDRCTEVLLGIVPVCSATSLDVIPFAARAIVRNISSRVGWARALSFATASIFSILLLIASAIPTDKLIQYFITY